MKLSHSAYITKKQGRIKSLCVHHLDHIWLSYSYQPPLRTFQPPRKGNVKITFSPLNETDVEDIVCWKYQPPYDVYNLDNDQETIKYVLDPQNCFHGIRDETGALIGFCSFGADGQVPGGDYSLEALDIGMGIQPDHTGQGRGREYVSMVLAYAQESFNPSRLRVTIASFNRRAQRVWEGNGFQRVQAFTHKTSGREFLVYLLEVKL